MFCDVDSDSSAWEKGVIVGMASEVPKTLARQGSWNLQNLQHHHGLQTLCRTQVPAVPKPPNGQVIRVKWARDNILSSA